MREKVCLDLEPRAGVYSMNDDTFGGLSLGANKSIMSEGIGESAACLKVVFDTA